MYQRHWLNGAVCGGLLAVVSSSAFADVVSWKNTIASGNWGTASNWDSEAVPGIGDDVTLAFNVANTNVTYTLGADREVNKLTITSKGSVGAAIEQATILTVASGNIDVLSSGTSGAGGIVSRIYIPDSAGNTPIWNISPVHNSWSFNGINASSAVTITRTGTSTMTLKVNVDNSATLAATWNMGTGPVSFGASGAFGTGQINFTGNTLTFPNSTNSQSNNMSFTGTSFINTGSTLGVTTITGNLTGSGTLDKSGNSTGAGALILAGTNNTHSGNIVHPRGLLALDGNFSGLGNITMSAGSSSEQNTLAGTGNVGMASSKIVTLTSNFVGKVATLAPGRDGTIGTLTIGTTGNSNRVELNKGSRLLIDLDATSSDRLVVNGQLMLDRDGAFNELYLNGTLSGISYTLATFLTSDGGTFNSVFFNGVDVTATALDPNGIGGTHQLVYGTDSLTLVTIPEPASLALLAVGGLMLIRRRR